MAGIFLLVIVAVLFYLGGYKEFKLASRPVLTVTVSETINTGVRAIMEKTVVTYAVTDSSAFKAVKLDTAGILQFTSFEVKEGKSRGRKLEDAITVVTLGFSIYCLLYTSPSPRD